ncbi:MAG: hypothetical protein KJ623_02590 [Nanoarchaeota archaeon]|nr:hypothetical protein [Nanoarchaeota archaeon]MBU0963314.1 hypothetical protein [Nanoarchaeota archaeon]
MIFADLHIHSRYSRACSKNITIENLVKYAKIKGLGLLGTGDFTHNLWLKDIKDKLKEKNGLYFFDDFPFILTGEISLMYTQGRGRRVHLVLLVPSLEVVEKINAYLDTKGRRDYDGRPIFKISCEEFTKEMMKISDEIEIIPAHCLLPNTLIHLDNEVKMIKDIKKGDNVLTHYGNIRKVKEILVHNHKGKNIKIVPWYFREGLETTLEHPFYAIKSYKNCKSTKGLCKKGCSEENLCRRRHFLNYRKEWIQAKDIEIGDFLIYPRVNKEIDLQEINLKDYILDCKEISSNFLIPKDARNHTGKIFSKIKVDKKLCRLIGYFLSEGYLITDSAIGFSFHSNEKEYFEEVISTIKDYFGFEITSNKIKENECELKFNSKILNSFFRNFYIGEKARANSKHIPREFIFLPKNKLAEIFRGWWRGDTGYTVSRQLANQMKLICLRLGIIPSIGINTIENYNKKGNHFIQNREIRARNDLIAFSNLSFFENDYGMLKENCFKKSINKLNRKHGWIDENYVYLPVRKIEIKDYSGEVYNLEVEKDNSYVSEFACVHNCWTPYFGVFGSKSGYDSLKEAFGAQFENIHAIETGMSSTPEMNWKISELNSKAIVSFSDSHSYWPWRLGREATIFEKIGSYKDIIDGIRENKILGTIETDPGYGIYHYDGHKDCNFSCSPKETKKLNGICPICHKPLTIGVDNRVLELGNQDILKNPNKKHYYKLLPLHEIIALAKNSGIATKKTWGIYNLLIEKFGNEFNILLKVNEKELTEALPNDKLLIELILKNREGNIFVKPGYDGIYGIPLLKPETKIKNQNKQKSLSEF